MLTYFFFFYRREHFLLLAKRERRCAVFQSQVLYEGIQVNKVSFWNRLSYNPCQLNKVKMLPLTNISIAIYPLNVLKGETWLPVQNRVSKINCLYESPAAFFLPKLSSNILPHPLPLILSLYIMHTTILT